MVMVALKNVLMVYKEPSHNTNGYGWTPKKQKIDKKIY